MASRVKSKDKLLAELQRLKEHIVILEKETAKHKLIEEKLKQNKELVQALLNSLPDIAVLTDTKGIIFAINEVSARYLKKSPGELIGACVYDFFPQDMVKRKKRYGNKVIKEKRPFILETHRHGKYTQNSIYPIINAQGKVIKLAVFIRDISEYRRAENAYKNSEEKYRNLVENISDVIYAINEEGVVIYVNPAIESLLGYKAEEVTGEHFQDFFHPSDLPLVMAEFERFLTGHTKKKEYRLLSKAGETKWARISSHPIFFKEKVIGYQGVVTDITQSKLIDSHIIKAEYMGATKYIAAAIFSEISESFKYIKKILSDFRNKYKNNKGIITDLELLKLKADDVESIINKFLDLKLLKMKRKRSLNINNVIKKYISLFQTQFAKYKIKINLDLDRKLAKIKALPLHIEQVFMNIFTGSIGALEKNKQLNGKARKLKVKTRNIGSDVIITVSDNGPGISEQEISHIFDPFYSYKRESRMNICLYICFKIIESYGGQIQVNNLKNLSGMQVTIKMPAVSEKN